MSHGKTKHCSVYLSLSLLACHDTFYLRWQWKGCFPLWLSLTRRLQGGLEGGGGGGVQTESHAEGWDRRRTCSFIWSIVFGGNFFLAWETSLLHPFSISDGLFSPGCVKVRSLADKSKQHVFHKRDELALSWISATMTYKWLLNIFLKGKLIYLLLLITEHFIIIKLIKHNSRSF